jgi:hypothetical protein
MYDREYWTSPNRGIVQKPQAAKLVVGPRHAVTLYAVLEYRKGNVHRNERERRA